MDAQALIAKALARREQWVDLEPGKRIRIRRPAETELPGLREGVTVERVIACTVGWEGFSEVDLLGATVGSEDALEFDIGLWDVLVRDRADWLATVANAIVKAVTEHLKQKDAAAKN